MSARLGNIFRGFILALLILFLVSVAFLIYTVRRSFPQTSGTIHISGLSEPVTIYRDRFGVPQIYASTTHDLFFAQGYIHAQDRFWQMDFWRHLGAGRLSEMFGKPQLHTDEFIRTLGWRRVAEQDIKEMDPTSVEIIQDYCDGVNAYLADHQGTALSLEYGVLQILNRNYRIAPWTPADSITWGMVMAWDLSENMGDEIGRATLLNTLAPEQIEDLYPPYPADHPVILPSQSTPPSDPTPRKNAYLLRPGIGLALDSALQHASLLTPLLGASDTGIGSNNWVISGTKTATGKPVLGNDPHLRIQMPSIWYEVGLHCATKSDECRWDVTGFSFAGVPGVVIGHNDRIAWGFTNVGPDVQDLYVEKINPQNPNQYEVNGTWKDMRLVHETILVSDDKPVDLTVRYTRHGPIISGQYSALNEVRKSAHLQFPSPYAISLRWTALEPGNTFPAIWRINLARNWDEFREAASHFDLPSQNMVYADVDGNIGYQTPGRIPIRAGGDGRYPAPGWTDANEWNGIIPYEELPHTLNPSQGFIASANNPVTHDYPYLIAADWDYGFRAKQIVDTIEGAVAPLTLQQIESMQGDNTNLNARTLVPLMLQVHLQNSSLERVREILRAWNQQDDMDSAGAALFESFWKHLLEDTFQDDLPRSRWLSGGSRSFEIVRRLSQQPHAFWWDDRKTAATEDRDQILSRAFAEAVHELQQTLGSDPFRWRWGDLHTATFRNATFGMSGISVLERIFNRGPYRAAGGNSIVNATSWYADESYEVADVPSMRMVVDLSNLSNSVSVITTGQSGHAFHPNYIDMADLWRNVQYHPMLWDRKQIEQDVKSVLTLAP